MKTVLSNIMGYYSILKRNNCVALVGDNLILTDDEGKEIARRDDLINIRKAIFLSEELLLVDCGLPKAYVAISLKDGSTCWQIDHPRLDYTSSKFAISCDCENVFDYYDYKMQTYLLRIDLTTHKLTTFVLKDSLRCTSDLICDDTGNPCLLQHHFEESGKYHHSLNGIRCESQIMMKREEMSKWNYRWQFPFPQISKFFLGSAEEILTEDLYVYLPKEKKRYYLLENDPRWRPIKKKPTGCVVDENKQYITLVYDNVNVIVDWASRKMIACYEAPLCCGCLVNNEFWVNLGNGVFRKPFPLIEEIPVQKNMFWKPY